MSEHKSRFGAFGRLLILGGFLVGSVAVWSPLATAQSELEVTSGGGESVAPPAATCVRFTQAGEWVSDPVLTHPLVPFLSSKTVAWGVFAGGVLLLYLMSFALFQGKLRRGGNPLTAFGRALAFWILAVGVTGYFLTGHLSYAENWCVDRSEEVIQGAAPARSDAEVVARYGVGINEVIDRRAIPLQAHIRLTPWYFWLGGIGVLSLFFLVGFRPSAGGSSTGAGRSSTDGPDSEDW